MPDQNNDVIHRALPMVPVEWERSLPCSELIFSEVTQHEGLRPFIRLRVTLPNGWVVWTDVAFDTEEAALQMEKGLLSLKMYAEPLLKHKPREKQP